ncbi:cupredoxin [Artemisia annua]|uniref:Cupredoxin n=1 Tax=Artemisia annua TaxID=35608 RepID=A0A2U1MB64_ARTAN|nr:cupredoxin [Artemisia annua]
MAVFKLSSLVIMAVMLACIQLHGSVAQRIHIVGGSLGWTVPPNGPSTYTTWASRETFTIGDTLLFNFTAGAHTVAEVAQAAYGPCNVATLISLSTTGPTRITLNTPGTHYYICSVGSHCQAGQKLSINVLGGVTSPVSPPTAATSPSPMSSPGPSQWEASPPSSPTGSTTGLSPTGSTTVQPPSPNGVARSYAALGHVTLLAIALAFFN